MRIVITGVGPISAAGIGKNDLWVGLHEQKTNLIEEKQLFGNDSISFWKYAVKDFSIADFGLSSGHLSELLEWKEGSVETDIYYLLAAAKLALDDSCLKYDREKNNIALVVAHENAGLEEYFRNMLFHSTEYYREKPLIADFVNYMYGKMAKQSFELQTFMPLHHVAKILGLHGYNLFINNACASGAYALEEAAQIIKSRKSNVVVVVAADNPQVFKYLWFKKLNLYSQRGEMKPFARDTDGFIFGDGAAGLVLESLDHAISRGAEIYGEYLGGGFCAEGWKVSLPNISEDFYGQVINEAFQMNHIAKEQVDVIVPHGISSRVTDIYEMRAIHDQFKGASSRIGVCTFKPLLGHTLGANVALEVIIILLMMKNQYLIREQLLENHAPEKFPDSLITFKPGKVTLVLKTTAAFAGYRSAILLRKLNLND